MLFLREREGCGTMENSNYNRRGGCPHPPVTPDRENSGTRLYCRAGACLLPLRCGMGDVSDDGNAKIVGQGLASCRCVAGFGNVSAGASPCPTVGCRIWERCGTMWASSPTGGNVEFRNPMQSPLTWVCIGEEEQGSERNFRREAEMEWCGLCDDDGASPCLTVGAIYFLLCVRYPRRPGCW